MATVHGTAALFDFNPGLFGGDELDFADYLDVEAMTADQANSWLAQDAHSSDFNSPLDTYFTAASGWTRSPGRQSVQSGSNGAPSTTVSPSTGSLILTPTSSNAVPLLGDATFIDAGEASENTSTSPGSSFSNSSDDYVHVGRIPGNPRGRRNMNTWPPSSSQSGAGPSSTHRPSTTSNSSAGIWEQPSSFATTSSTGGWMDQTGGQWGELDLSLFGYGLGQAATLQSFDTDPLLDINAFTGIASRGLDDNTHFRPNNATGQLFVQNPYGANYAFATQPSPQSGRSTTAARPVVGPHHHAPPDTMLAGHGLTEQHRLDFPPAVPPTFTEATTRNNEQSASRVETARVDNNLTTTTPNFTPVTGARPDRHAPYPQPTPQQQQPIQPSHPSRHTHLPVPPSAAVQAVNRQLQPSKPGSGRDGATSTLVDRTHRGGRKKNTRLTAGVRERSHLMRKTGACWRCALQRDPCPDEGTPCGRCHVRSQRGQTYFFGCDRSKLPDFVYDFLPPSMTGMHQKQSIEDYVAHNVVRWDGDNSIDIWLTCGYGPALRWKLYEFQPRDDEPCWQFQYLQDPITRQQIQIKKYSPPFGLMKLETSDDAHFDGYLEQLLHPQHLADFGWTCFEEETEVDDFQARLLQAICDLATGTQDDELRELLRKILRMMALTYIMGHTLTLIEDTAYGVIDAVQMSPTPKEPPSKHVSPRLASRQLKFFFHILREKIYVELLNWQQQTLRSSPKKEATWLPAFCVTLSVAMMLEEVQRTIFIQADAKSKKDATNMTRAQAETEALNACERIDDRYKLLVGLFQCKYRDKKWTFGSFGNQTPELSDPHSRHFLREVMSLLCEKNLRRGTSGEPKRCPIGITESVLLYVSLGGALLAAVLEPAAVRVLRDMNYDLTIETTTISWRTRRWMAKRTSKN
ncbi:hypothetical protein LTR56_022694 [Elasticomyces elasticus]|nr:hypothetical protein LTR56_022694 [Elasticomyces elasticus]KAK5764871.1 hypothetical protein LTS12_004898 [Elasticomyces elasticus]